MRTTDISKIQLMRMIISESYEEMPDRCTVRCHLKTSQGDFHGDTTHYDYVDNRAQLSAFNAAFAKLREHVEANKWQGTPPHVERMKLEASQLDDRITKLKAYLAGDPPARGLLDAQLGAMESYYSILKLRLAS